MVMRAVKSTRGGKKQQTASKLPRIAIVMSLFNETICRGLLEGARECLRENGFDTAAVPVFEVPGAFEIPLVAQKLISKKRCAGVVALGCIIRGETPHFEYVSQGAMMGCQMVALKAGKPVAFGILTTNDEAQALRRAAPDAFNKGREAVHALLETLETLHTAEHMHG